MIQEFCTNYGFLTSLVFLYVFLKILYTCWCLIYSIFYVYVCGALFMKSRLKKYGEWAVVTGSTRGIGVEYARQLAQLGLNIALVARNEKLMKNQAQKLESDYGIKTQIIVADFGHTDKQKIDKVCEALSDKDIGILINNAGIMYDHPDYFDKVPAKMLEDIISVNMTWPTLLTHFIISKIMIPKNKGLVVFMSSSAGEMITPLLSAYAASKSYIANLAKSMAVEYADTGVHVQVLCPFYIATDMTKYSDFLNTPQLFSPSAEKYVCHALRTFGMCRHTTGYMPHTLQRTVFHLLIEHHYGQIALKWQLHLQRNNKRTQ